MKQSCTYRQHGNFLRRLFRLGRQRIRQETYKVIGKNTKVSNGSLLLQNQTEMTINHRTFEDPTRSKTSLPFGPRQGTRALVNCPKTGPNCFAFVSIACNLFGTLDTRDPNRIKHAFRPMSSLVGSRSLSPMVQQRTLNKCHSSWRKNRPKRLLMPCRRPWQRI